MLNQRRYEEKEKTLFTKSIFPSLILAYAICVTSIFYHAFADLSIKLVNLIKILPAGQKSVLIAFSLILMCQMALVCFIK